MGQAPDHRPQRRAVEPARGAATAESAPRGPRGTSPRLRVAAQGVLALVGLVLVGVGLALVSGVSGAHPSRETLAVVQPAVPPAGTTAAPPSRFRRPRSPAGRDGGPRPVGRLAIVIDDIGHSLPALRRLLALDVPLSFSVLPHVTHAREAARAIARAGREYMVHMPMEPYAYPREDPGPRPLLLAQSLAHTAERVRGYLAALPGAVGASNHMGSAYTYDPDRMRVVQTVLAERNLFFLNSRTSGTPVPRAVARQRGYRYLERDVFLDHDPRETAVESAFRLAVRRARRQGRAIAIGHPYDSTYRVLRRRLPGLPRNGVRVVPVSALLRR